MSTEATIEKLKKIDNDDFIQNLIAQANARYILLNTSESRENFPSYTINDESLNILAFYYLNIGCSFAENKDLESAREPLEKGAAILEFIHGAEINKNETSNYYGLISALSYYVGFQYSKSYILIQKLQSSTVISNLVHLFLQRDYNKLTNEINKVVVDPTYSDEFISQNSEEIDSSKKVYEIVIAKALDGFVKYFYSGNQDLLIKARRNLQNLKEITEIQAEPDIWWVIRLLLLISDGLNEASLWNSLRSHFDINSIHVKNYIQSLTYQFPRGIYELFITQRKSLSKILNSENKGCVVSIPTSSGKTRIAEIAILDCLLKETENKVLYIAPFRSLAFEIENSLEKILGNVDISVSHLYGGSLYSKLDEKIIEDSDVIIATPEKAKAILRGNKDLMNQIKLIIIDEGHLLGPDKRLIVNEIFYEELRYFIGLNGGRFILLSAVLPNSEELAEWLTDSKDTVYKDKWRPSDERLGILEWTGESVNLNWESSDIERASFNKRFIVKERQPLKAHQRVERFFPSNRNEAVASTAYKLRGFGPALIFVGQKQSVFTMADAYLKCLGTAPEDFKWKNSFDWRTFELACIETYGEDSNWFLYARKGILCHNANLHSDVRLPLERLMRADKPLVIISTSTLGQGVNLGVSSVLFSTLYQSGELITPRDFWNIAGRSGRAFVDHEGKILVALDVTDTSTQKAKYKIRYHRDTIKKYFDKANIDVAKSGILALIKFLAKVAVDKGISFELLLQLISENKTQEIGDNAKDIDDTLDWIDDTLLSLHHLHNETIDEIDYSWVETFFRKSLAFIQTTNETVITGDQVLAFIKSRVEGIALKVGSSKTKWESIIKSGIPLNSDLLIEDKLPEIIDRIHIYNETEKSIDNKINLLKEVEKIIEGIPVLAEEGDLIKSQDMDSIRERWLKGVPISEIISLENGIEIITKLYAYKLPWLLNGIAKKLRNLDMKEEAETTEEISILIEAGLPSLTKVKVYQAGIRSRFAANEIGDLFDDELWSRSVKDYKRDLVFHKEFYKEQVSKNSVEWIDLLARISRHKDFSVASIPKFNFGKVHEKTNILIAKEVNGKQYLMSPDLSYIKEIKNSDIDFSSVNEVAGILFKYHSDEDSWIMHVENPYVQTG